MDDTGATGVEASWRGGQGPLIEYSPRLEGVGMVRLGGRAVYRWGIFTLMVAGRPGHFWTGAFWTDSLN